MAVSDVEFWSNLQLALGTSLNCSVGCAEVVEQHDNVFQSGVPNCQGCKVPVHSNIDIDYWRSMLSNYHDANLCDLLEFGFSIGFEGPIPHSGRTVNNHSGSVTFPVDMRIVVEL